MQPTKTLRSLLVISGLTAIGIGSSIPLAPARFHANHGIEIGTDASLLSEIRAAGGALMVLGFMILIGVFVRQFTLASTSIAATVYLAYGASRLLTVGREGVPAGGLVGAAAIELAIGVVCAVALVRPTRRASVAMPSTAHMGEVA